MFLSSIQNFMELPITELQIGFGSFCLRQRKQIRRRIVCGSGVVVGRPLSVVALTIRHSDTSHEPTTPQRIELWMSPTSNFVRRRTRNVFAGGLRSESSPSNNIFTRIIAPIISAPTPYYEVFCRADSWRHLELRRGSCLQARDFAVLWSVFQ